MVSFPFCCWSTGSSPVAEDHRTSRDTHCENQVELYKCVGALHRAGFPRKFSLSGSFPLRLQQLGKYISVSLPLHGLPLIPHVHFCFSILWSPYLLVSTGAQQFSLWSQLFLESKKSLLVCSAFSLLGWRGDFQFLTRQAKSTSTLLPFWFLPSEKIKLPTQWYCYGFESLCSPKFHMLKSYIIERWWS